MTNYRWIFVSVPLMIVIGACGAGVDSSDVPSAPTVATSKQAKAPAGSITESGTLLVGSEVKPGTYRAEVPEDSLGCYYARLSSEDDSAIIANGLGSPGDRMTVTIRNRDKAFHTDGCGIWVLVRARK